MYRSHLLSWYMSNTPDSGYLISVKSGEFTGFEGGTEKTKLPMDFPESMNGLKRSALSCKQRIEKLRRVKKFRGV